MDDIGGEWRLSSTVGPGDGGGEPKPGASIAVDPDHLLRCRSSGRDRFLLGANALRLPAHSNGKPPGSAKSSFMNRGCGCTHTCTFDDGVAAGGEPVSFADEAAAWASHSVECSLEKSCGRAAHICKWHVLLQPCWRGESEVAARSPGSRRQSWLVTLLHPSAVYIRDGPPGSAVDRLKLRQPFPVFSGDATIFFDEPRHAVSVRLWRVAGAADAAAAAGGAAAAAVAGSPGGSKRPKRGAGELSRAATSGAAAGAAAGAEGAGSPKRQQTATITPAPPPTPPLARIAAAIGPAACAAAAAAAGPPVPMACPERIPGWMQRQLIEPVFRSYPQPAVGEL
eukprot:SAG22_NODE_1314_length_4773_cov_3.303594_1_plen_339_part_00